LGKPSDLSARTLAYKVQSKIEKKNLSPKY